jgi:hypothetical protein
LSGADCGAGISLDEFCRHRQPTRFEVRVGVLPSDLYQPEAVATVSGLSGAAAGIGTIVGFKAVGYLSDARHAAGTHAFDPIMVACGLIPALGGVLVLWLIRARRSPSGALKSV